MVGAYYEASNTNGSNTSDGSDNSVNSGAVYVFIRDNNQWIQQAYIKPSHIDFEIDFGRSLDIDGNTLVIGSSGDNREVTGINPPASNNNSGRSGAAYVFTRTGSDWSEQKILRDVFRNDDDKFGYSCAIDGDKIVIGAPEVDTMFDPNSGRIIFYTRTGSSWDNGQATSSNNSGQFGFAVDMQGDLVIAGAHFLTDGASATSSGDAAIVYQYESNSWTEKQLISAYNPTEFDFFGYSVGISNNTIVAGAPLEDSNSSGIYPADFASGANNDDGSLGACPRIGIVMKESWI